MLENKPNPFLDRRTLLQAGASLLALSAISPGFAAGLDLDDPEDLLKALIKLRGSLDDRPVMWWMKGTRFGVVDDTTRPLYNMLVGSFHRYWKVDNGWRVRILELGAFTDLETGEVLNEFNNPYSGKTVKVPDQLLGPYEVTLTTKGVVIDPGTTFSSIDLTTGLGPAMVHGDDIWIREDSVAKVASHQPMMGKHTYNELVTYQGRVSDLNDDSLLTAPASVTYQSLTSWREWMGSEGVGGHTTGRASGGKIFSVDEFPADYLAAVRKRHPEVMQDPVAAMDAKPEPPG